MAPTSSSGGTVASTVDEVHAMVDRNGKVPPPQSYAVFLATLGIAVPLWVTVLPFSVLWGVTKAVVGKILPSKPPDNAPFDSGIEVDPKDIKDRKDRKYDVVLMGATGFTGKLALRYLAKNYGVNGDVKWAIAGRSKSKLEAAKESVAEESGVKEVLELETILVDTWDVATLPNLVKDTKVVLTTVGPFARHGSPVVESCAKYGTHYVDITGEDGWVRQMILRWDDTAQKTGAKLVSHCGCDCIPSDATVMMLESALPEGEELDSALALQQMEGGASGGTFSTILMGLEGETNDGHSHDFDPALKLPDGSRSTCNTKFTPPFINSVKQAGRYFGSYLTFFFLSIPNAATVKRSNALRGRSSLLKYQEGVVHPDFKTGFVVLFTQIFLLTLLSNPVTGYFMKKALPKPGEGPTMDEMENKFFFCITGYGVGSKGSRTRSVLYYPKDVGYLETARMISECALSLAFDEEKLPSKKGGCFSPTTALGQNLLDRLTATGSKAAAELVSSE